MSAKREISSALGIHRKSWDRWVSGRTTPTKPVLMDMAAKLLADDRKLSIMARFRGSQSDAWDWIVDELAAKSGAAESTIIRLLGAKGEMVHSAPSPTLMWRALEMSLWVSAKVRLTNFLQINWDERTATLRDDAHEERRFDYRIGWFDVNMPFDIAGRPPPPVETGKWRTQARDTGDIPLAPRRLRPGA